MDVCTNLTSLLCIYSLSGVVGLSVIKVEGAISLSPLQSYQQAVRVVPTLSGGQTRLLHGDDIATTNVDLHRGKGMMTNANGDIAA